MKGRRPFVQSRGVKGGGAPFDENMHAPEESFRLGSFTKGREACARMYGELAK